MTYTSDTHAQSHDILVRPSSPVPVLALVSVSIGISNQHKLAQAGRIELTFRTPIPTGRAGG